VRFTGDELFVFPADGFDSCRAFAHRAFCASAIRLRAATDVTQPRLTPLREALEPFRPTSPSTTEIADCNFSTLLFCLLVLLPKLLECAA
jgi:hypothetical protein